MCFYLRNWQVTSLLYTLGVFITEYTAKALRNHATIAWFSKYKKSLDDLSSRLSQTMRVTGIEISLQGKISVSAYLFSSPSSRQVAITNFLTDGWKRRRSDGIISAFVPVYFYKDRLCISFI